MQGTGRGRVVAVLVAVSLMLAAVVTGASAAQLTVATVPAPAVDPPLPDASFVGGLAPSPDGTMVGILQYSAGIMRIDADGRMRAAKIADRGVTSYGPYGGAPTSLANGQMAFLADLFRGVDTRRMVLGTLAPGSTVPRFTSIPASGPYTDWDTTAIAPDGAVWRSLACRGVLSRTSPRGEERRIHLPPIRCHEAFRIGYGAAFAFGADGSVWFASLCQARIVRIPLVGPRREWRLARRRHCERSTDELVQLHPMLLATPDGGVRFEGGRIDGRGRLVHDSAPLPDAVGSDGTEWRFEPDAITSRAPDGRVRRLPVPAEQDARIIAGALGADGRFWYLSAATVSYERQGSYNVNAHVGVTDADGALTDRPLPPSDGLSPRLAPSPDGSMWLLAGRSLQHVAAAPSPPLELRRQARVTRFLARRGATVWIQVRCSAPPGTYCTSVAKLFASWARIAVHRVRFAVPAGEARAIPLTLTRRAMARLHKQGHLDPYTAIDVGGGYVAGRIHVR